MAASVLENLVGGDLERLRELLKPEIEESLRKEMESDNQERLEERMHDLDKEYRRKFESERLAMYEEVSLIIDQRAQQYKDEVERGFAGKLDRLEAENAALKSDLETAESVLIGWLKNVFQDWWKLKFLSLFGVKQIALSKLNTLLHKHNMRLVSESVPGSKHIVMIETKDGQLRERSAFWLEPVNQGSIPEPVASDNDQ